MRRYVQSLVLLCVISACGSSESLRQNATQLAAGAGMQPAQAQGGEFSFALFERIKDPAAPVRIYIEGDGNAWLTRNQVSPDPTPIDPTALTLAVRDTGPNVVYFARPCQYVMSNACDTKYWTSAQFSETIIAAINEAMNRWHGHKLELVGYSGGGAVAVLIAARRGDVVSLRTVAGNVDTSRFTTIHSISPFTDSLNPADVASRVAMIPQLHFVGEKDTVVPVAIVQSYQAHLPATHCSAYQIIPGADHYSGWVQSWNAMLAAPLPCSKPN